MSRPKPYLWTSLPAQFATIAGWILFKEKLSFKQLLAIAFVIALIFILRLTS
jgi:multidrug transporter EmrE-like cation transporter